jgi:hypothetical protein
MKNIGKRRLNYITSEDFYFLAYEMLLILKSLYSATGAAFKDHRKLAYLVHIISDSRLIGIMERNKGRHISSSLDKELLFNSFTSGELHKRDIYKIMLSLQKRGFITLSKGVEPEVFNIQLNMKSIPAEFFASGEFSSDFDIINRLKIAIPRISSLTIDTFLERAYKDYGLNVWAC